MPMVDPNIPTIIRGPAAILYNGKYFFSKGDIQAETIVSSFKITDDIHGEIDERKIGQYTRITFTPTGIFPATDLSQYFPLTSSMVGQSIFGAPASPLPIVIYTKYGGATDTGQSYTYARGGPSKNCSLIMRPRATLFGTMEFIAINAPTIKQNVAAFWRTIADFAFPTVAAGFDGSLIITDRYLAAYDTFTGATSIGAHEGFELDAPVEVQPIPDDDQDPADFILTSVSGGCRFAPNTLTTAQFDTLMNLQGVTAAVPGQSIANTAHDLVITGSGNGSVKLVATLKNCAPKQCTSQFGMMVHRHKMIEFSRPKATWSAGAIQPIWTFAIS